jgi:micrococcal nuclease
MLSRKRAIVLGMASTLFLIACVLALPEIRLRFPLIQNQGESSEEQEVYRVTRVVDGDTVELGDGRKVRYIGINTPETVDPRRQVECFGKEASAFNASLVEGKMVRLERDVSGTDKYGRLLRFVYLEDGTFVNEVLVREGYAYASAYAPDLTRKFFFAEAEKDARKNQRGLWSPDTCDGRKESVH